MNPTRLTARLATIAAVGLGALVLLAPAAAAHNVPDAAQYDSRILSITPPVPELTVTTSTAGEYLNLAYTGASTIIVEGYKGEPYLKITKSGAWQNQRSESTYLNASLFGDALTNNQNLGDPNHPDWKQIGHRGVAGYHDHRIHWMGVDRPPVVQNDPEHDHLIATWRVHLLADGKPVTVNGELRWLAIKPTNFWPLLGPILAVAVVGIVAVVIARVRISRTAATRAGDGRTLEPDASPGGITDSPPGRKQAEESAAKRS